MYKYEHRTRGHPRLQRLLAFIFTLIMLVTMVPADLTKADVIDHTHIWATKYDDKNHWEYCTVCGEKRNVTAHVFTDHWVYGYESCNSTNYDQKICSCGYSYIYHKPHDVDWSKIVKVLKEWKEHMSMCKNCGEQYGAQCTHNGKRISCANYGTCDVCGTVYTAEESHTLDPFGMCTTCGYKVFDIIESTFNYLDDFSGGTFTLKIKPLHDNVDFNNVYWWATPSFTGTFSGNSGMTNTEYGMCPKGKGFTLDSDGITRIYKWNFTFRNDNKTTYYLCLRPTINGAIYSSEYSYAFSIYRDHQAPVQNDVIQKDQASANGWATIKQLILTGTENTTDTIQLTIADKITGEKYVTDATVSVVDGKYSYTCTPSIEGDANGRTYIVTAKDTNGNSSAKEFVISKTDGSAPQLKNDTSLTYTDWTNTAKDISLSFFDFGSGGVQASLDNQTDYKALTKSGEYYIWNHSFGNQVGTTEHTIYVKDALGNATSYKLTVGNTDSNVYSVSYDLNGGAMSGQKTSYTVADSFTLPTPTKTGYTFTGWTGSNGATPQKTVTVNKGTRGNLSYTANWSANQYYVTFNGNEGSLNIIDETIAKNNNGTATAKVQYDANNYYILGIMPTRQGYTFKGFYDAPSGGIQVLKPYDTANCLSVASKYYNENYMWKYTGNVTLYAQWEPITWTMKYDANGGTGVMANTKHVYYGGIHITRNSFTRLGYSFNGWYATRMRNGKTEYLCGTLANQFIDGAEWYEKDKIPPDKTVYKWIDNELACLCTYIDNDVITLHAQWTVNTYTNQIAHWTWGYKNQEGNNGNKTAFQLDTTTFQSQYGSEFTMDSAKAVKVPNGFYLLSFGTNNIDGVWKDYRIGTKVIQKDCQMEFQYDYTPIPYSITYNLNGGTNNSANPSTYTVLYGVSLKAPTRAGYTFTGWYDENGNKITGINEGCNAKFSNVDDLYAKLAARTTGNRILTAHWSYNPISVKVPQVLTGDHTGKSQFRVKCDDFKAGSIKVTVPDSFLYKQSGKSDVTATITSKSGNNIITPSNKVCVYDIITKNGLSAGCWSGNFNIGLTLTKE